MTPPPDPRRPIAVLAGGFDIGRLCGFLAPPYFRSPTAAALSARRCETSPSPGHCRNAPRHRDRSRSGRERAVRSQLHRAPAPVSRAAAHPAIRVRWPMDQRTARTSDQEVRLGADGVSPTNDQRTPAATLPGNTSLLVLAQTDTVARGGRADEHHKPMLASQGRGSPRRRHCHVRNGISLLTPRRLRRGPLAVFHRYSRCGPGLLTYR